VSWVSVPNGETDDMDIRAYAKYLMREGTVSEKRELLGNLRSRLMYQDKTVRLVTEASQ
jgi:hypothetical protein